MLKRRDEEVLRKIYKKMKLDLRKGSNIEKKIMIKLSYCHTRDALVC